MVLYGPSTSFLSSSVTVLLFLKKPLYLAVLLLGLYVAPMRQSQAPLASTFV
jgi:hypothetical protein